MGFSFTFERLTVGDVWALWRLAQKAEYSPDEILTFLAMVERAYDGSVYDVPFAEHTALLDAFSVQFKAFTKENPVPAPPDLQAVRCFLAGLDTLDA